MLSDVERLRQILNTCRSGGKEPDISHGSISAAVLILLLCHSQDWKILLVRRSKELKHHAGEISFPGGCIEPADADLEATACRELSEETGIPCSMLEIIGQMTPVVTSTGFHVTPFLGITYQKLNYRHDRAEIDDIVEVPLSFFDSTPVKELTISAGPVEKKGLGYVTGHGIIWGATARMIGELVLIIRLFSNSE